MISRKSIKLEKWFRIYGQWPMMTTTIVFILIGFLQTGREFIEQQKITTRSLQQTVDMISLGLLQNNRVLLESALDATRWQLGSTSTKLCKDEKIIIATGSHHDCGKESVGWVYKRLSQPVSGFSGYTLELIMPLIPQGSPILWITGVSIALLCAYLLFLARVKQRFSRDILVPLRDSFARDEPMLIEELERVRQLQKALTDAQVTTAVADAILKQNQQVAHDIRSPLAALTVVEQTTRDLQEETRILIRSAVTRIREIANNLLAKNGATISTRSPAFAANVTSIELLACLLDQILDEKRIQYRHRQNLDIQFTHTPEAYALCAKINPTEFKRILSNLMNNSIEALPTEHSGKITLHLKPVSENTLELSISDNGSGIPPEILSKLTERGATFGKTGGSGLGLYHAKTTMEAWGGSLRIDSTVGKGTTVTLALPRARVPHWFVEALSLEASATVIVLDDDPSIHEIWKNRIIPLKQKVPDLTLLDFSTPPELEEWVNKNTMIWDQAVYLVDYELRGFQETGLDTIHKLGIQSRSILVSSRFEDEELRRRCDKLGIKLIPKSLAGFVPIKI